MIYIKVNGEFLELPSGFSLAMALKSPVFNTDGSASYPFKIFSTPKNRKILQFPERIQRFGQWNKSFDCQLFYNTIPFLSGTLKCISSDNAIIEGSIYEGNGDFNYKRQNKNIQDFDYGYLSFMNSTAAIDYANSLTHKIYPEVNLAYPQIFNDTYWTESGPFSPTNLINPHFGDGLLHEIDPGLGRTIIIPFIYLKYIIKTLIKYMGYDLDFGFLDSNSDFNKLLIYNSVTNNTGATDILVYNLEKIFFNYHIPRMSVEDFITSLQNFFNIQLFFDSKFKKVKIVSLNELVNSSEVAILRNILYSQTLTVDSIAGIHLKMETDAGDSNFDILTQAEEDMLNYYKGSVNKLTDLPSVNVADPWEVRYVISEDKYYRNEDGAWIEKDAAAYSLKTQLLYKDATTNINTKFSTLLSDENLQVICKNKRTDWKDITPRIFFKDILEDLDIVIGRNYTDEFSLFMDGDKGLFNKFYKAWADWKISSRKVKIIKKFTPQEFLDFDFSKKYDINGTRYLISEVDFTIKNDSIDPATIYAYTCP
jgi:hypothetical protein